MCSIRDRDVDSPMSYIHRVAVRLGSKPTHLAPLAAQRTKPEMAFSHLATDAILKRLSGRQKPVAKELRSREFRIIQCPVIPLPWSQDIIPRRAVPADQHADDSENNHYTCHKKPGGNHVASYKKLRWPQQA